MVEASVAEEDRPIAAIHKVVGGASGVIGEKERDRRRRRRRDRARRNRSGPVTRLRGEERGPTRTTATHCPTHRDRRRASICPFRKRVAIGVQPPLAANSQLDRSEREEGNGDEMAREISEETVPFFNSSLLERRWGTIVIFDYVYIWRILRSLFYLYRNKGVYL